jgi:hypothetical protein
MYLLIYYIEKERMAEATTRWQRRQAEKEMEARAQAWVERILRKALSQRTTGAFK